MALQLTTIIQIILAHLQVRIMILILINVTISVFTHNLKAFERRLILPLILYTQFMHITMQIGHTPKHPHFTKGQPIVRTVNGYINISSTNRFRWTRDTSPLTGWWIPIVLAASCEGAAQLVICDWEANVTYSNKEIVQERRKIIFNCNNKTQEYRKFSWYIMLFKNGGGGVFTSVKHWN